MKNTLQFYVNNIINDDGIFVFQQTEFIKFINKNATTIFGVPIPELRSNKNWRKNLTEYIAEIKLPDSIELDSGVRVATDVFGLEPASQTVLQSVWDLGHWPDVREMQRYVMPCIGLEMDTSCQFARMFKISDEDMKRAIDELSACDLISVVGDCGYVELTPLGTHIFCTADITADGVREFVTGAPASGDLTAADFAAVSGDYEFASDILRGAIREQSRGINILIHGGVCTGKTEIAKTLIQGAECRAFIANENGDDRDERWETLKKYQRILASDKSSVILCDDADEMLVEERYTSRARHRNKMAKLLATNARPIVWAARDASEIAPEVLRCFTYCFEMRAPDELVKKEMWRGACARQNVSVTDQDLCQLSQIPNLNTSIMERAVTGIKLTGNITAANKIIDGINRASGHGDTDANRNAPTTPFNTELLNTDTNLEKLADMLTAAPHQNFSLCLYGVSGTGKSAFAKYLAARMGRGIIYRRASDLLGKYVGETEKNIASAFRDATKQNKILVFDEADSFLQSRATATQRWHISEVNEMLTQMEDAQIPFICTTNLMDKLDNASLRRFTFKVKYDYMTQFQARLAFVHFLGTELPADIALPTGLTPGDFMVVKKRSSILGITDIGELVSMLSDEVAAKNIKQPNKIGF